MPPKKKKSSKKSGKSGKSGNKSAKEVDAEEIQIDEPELNREFFVFHIRELERKLRLYKEKSKVLREQNDEYLKKQKELTELKSHRVNTFKDQLFIKGDELSDLKDRYYGLQQAKETERSRYEAQLQEIQSKMQETKDVLTAENNLLSAKLSALEEFKVLKEKYEEEYKELALELERKKQEHEEKLEKIESKQFQDRDRLKKEIVSKINLVAAEFRKVSQKQTSETTKRTIRENVSIRSQLIKMSDKNVELQQENMQMRQKVRENRRKLRELEASHTELAGKNSSHSKLLHMLILKYKEYQELVDEYSKDDDLLKELEKMNIQLEESLEKQKGDIEKVVSEAESMGQEVDVISGDIDEIEEEIGVARLALVSSVKELRELLSLPNAVGRGRDSRNKSAGLESRTESAVSKTSGKVKSETGSATSFEIEWGSMAQRTLADEKLQRLISFLDYREEEEDEEEDELNEEERNAGIATELQGSLLSQIGLPPQSASISIDSKKLSQLKRLTPLPSIAPSSPLKQSQKPKILSEYEIRREAKIMLMKQREGYCVPGSLQMVPHMARHIPSNQEKTEALNKKMLGLNIYRSELDVEMPIKSKMIGGGTYDRYAALKGNDATTADTKVV